MPALEAAAAYTLAEFAAAANRIDASLGAKTLAIAAGRACFAGLASPLTTTKGVGPEITRDDLTQLEGFFRSHGVAHCTVELAPWSAALSAKLLHDAGYEAVDEEHVLLRDLQQNPATEPQAGVRPIRNPHAFTQLLMDAFAMPDEPPYRLLGEAIFALPRAANLVLEVDGELAAGAQMVPVEYMATLACDGTREAYRGRGLQTRLILERTRLATKLGLRWATAEVQPGSGSQRNYLRCGYHIAYTRTHWRKHFP